MNIKSILATIGVAALGAFPVTQVHAVPVGLEMVLMMDTSGSIDNNDFTIQKNGYRDAFLDTTVQGLIAATPGGVAVTLVQWSTGQNQTIGWRLLQNAADATSFANAINAMGRTSADATGTTNALNFSANLLATNAYQGARSVIDVSSDGEDNTAPGCFDNTPCAALQAARNAFLADSTHAINALWMADGTFYSTATLLAYGAANLIGGTDSFQGAVLGSSTFDFAMRTKLAREIGGVPEPGTLALFAIALFGAFGGRRLLKR